MNFQMFSDHISFLDGIRNFHENFKEVEPFKMGVLGSES